MPAMVSHATACSLVRPLCVFDPSLEEGAKVIRSLHQYQVSEDQNRRSGKSRSFVVEAVGATAAAELATIGVNPPGAGAEATAPPGLATALDAPGRALKPVLPAAGDAAVAPIGRSEPAEATGVGWAAMGVNVPMFAATEVAATGGT